MITVEALYTYPLKSARAVPLRSAKLVETGFEWDRHWMVAGENGVFYSQRTHPTLARIQPVIADGSLRLEMDGLEPLRVPLEPAGDRRPVQVWRDAFESLDQGEAASRWLSGALGAPARLIRFLPGSGRHADPQFAGPSPVPTTLVDGFPLLVCNRASLDALNERMPQPVPIDRFRPNLVLSGLEPWQEDRIDAVQIGDVELQLVKPCTRCITTSTDQQTGERTTNPLPVLRTFRFDKRLKGVLFGSNAVIRAGVGRHIEVGAQCRLRYRAD